MLTPRFNLTQNDEFLIVTIYAPFTHIDQTEIFMDETDFRFYSKPYYLRLHLPGSVTESDKANGHWDSESNSFVVKCPKVNVGETFEGLDMLTQLLLPKGLTQVKNNVEIIEECGSQDQEDEEAIDWYYEQNLEDEQVKMSIGGDGYGFGLRHTNVYTSLMSEFSEIIDIKDPDGLSQSERDEFRYSNEVSDFSSDHYLCDLYESVEEIKECLDYRHPFSSCMPDLHSTSVNLSHPCLKFNDREQEQLLSLPSKGFTVPSNLRNVVHLGLADILFGYYYSARVLGEDSVELGWSCAKLSSTLSCLARFDSPKELVKTAIRRSLVYPLYRHWELALASWRDVVSTLLVGKAAIVKILLSLITAFNERPGYHIFNQLYLHDYTLWTQTLPETHTTSLANAITQVLSKISKYDIGLEIQELEDAAKLTLLEEESRDVGLLSCSIANMKVEDQKDSDDDETDDESETDDVSSDNSKGS